MDKWVKQVQDSYLSKLPELIRYLVVGLLTMGLDYLLYSMTYALSENILLAENLKIPVVLAFNYFMHRKFTFGSEAAKTKEIGQYLLANVLIALVANLYLFALVAILTDAYLAKLVQTTTYPLFTYLVLSKLVYRKA